MPSTGQEASSPQIPAVTRKQRLKEVGTATMRQESSSSHLLVAEPAKIVSTTGAEKEDLGVAAPLQCEGHLQLPRESTAVAPASKERCSITDIILLEEDAQSTVPEPAKKHVRLAKASLVEGVAKLKETAGHVAAALQSGATQSQIGEALGTSQSWVSQMRKWHEDGCPGTPFGPQSKQKRLIQKQKLEYLAPNKPPATTGAEGREYAVQVRMVASSEKPIAISENPSAPTDTAVSRCADVSPLPEVERKSTHDPNSGDSVALWVRQDDSLDVPAFLIQLSPQEQLLADELIDRLRAATERVRRYVLSRVQY